METGLAGRLSRRFPKHILVIECKFVGAPKSSQYHAQMCDAYIELSDIHLNPDLARCSMYLVTNRPPVRGDQRAFRKNYQEVSNESG